MLNLIPHEEKGVFCMVDPKKCISCGTCINMCQVESISFKDGKAWIDPNICIKCGTCEAVCPVNAIKIER